MRLEFLVLAHNNSRICVNKTGYAGKKRSFPDFMTTHLEPEDERVEHRFGRVFRHDADAVVRPDRNRLVRSRHFLHDLVHLLQPDKTVQRASAILCTALWSENCVIRHIDKFL